MVLAAAATEVVALMAASVEVILTSTIVATEENTGIVVASSRVQILVTATIAVSQPSHVVPAWHYSCWNRFYYLLCPNRSWDYTLSVSVWFVW